MGLALALLGIALALLPLGLSAIGYELSPKQGYGILSLAGFFVIVAVIVFFWPWITEAWSRLRRDSELQQSSVQLKEAQQEREELQQENKELIVGLQKLQEELDELRARDPVARWDNAIKTLIVGKNFRNQRVELDGYSYSNCTFVNVTFVYKGELPYDLAGNDIKGCYVDTASPPLQGLMLLLYHLHMLNPEIDTEEIQKALGPPARIKIREDEES